MFVRRLAPLGLVFAALTGLSAQGTLPSGIAWQPDFAAAMAKAKSDNRPVMIAFAMEDEPANVQVANTHFKQAAVIAKSREFVCLLGIRARHGDVDGVKADGSTGPVSSLYGSATAADLTRVETQARTKILEAERVAAPQFVFLAPDGRILLRHVWLLSPSELVTKMERALAYFDPANAVDSVKAAQARVTELLAQAQGGNQTERRAALRELMLNDDPRILPLLVELTGPTVDSQKRLEAVFFMGQKGNATASVVLHKLLRDADTDVRAYVAVALEAIGLPESEAPLMKALKGETKERVRRNLLRAMFACGGDTPEFRKILLAFLGGKSDDDKLVALWVAANVTMDAPLEKAILRLIEDKVANVRCSVYRCIGQLKIVKAGKPLLAKVGSERGDPEACCKWALAQLGLGDYEGEVDPDEVAKRELDDEDLREGDLEGSEERRRSGGGRSGGGRSGGGGRGGRGGGRGR